MAKQKPSGSQGKKAAPPVSTRPAAPAKPLPPWLHWLVPLVLATLFGLLHFDVKISEGNDDAMYIEAAWKYAQDYTGYFYSANAPLYPMLLGLVAMFSGLNLILFKAINVALFVTHLALMYLAFRRRVPLAVLTPVLLFTAVNAYFLYYASQTYTEMLFITLQAAFLLVFFNGYEKLTRNAAGDAATVPLARVLITSLAIGTMLFILSLCKNIAIGMAGAVLLFLLIEKRFKLAAYVLGAFAIVKYTFEGVKLLVWGAAGQYGSQGAILLQKNAYDASKGNEDLTGFVNRFFGNFDLFLGKRLWQILGFRDSEASTTITLLALLVLAIVLFAAWRITLSYRAAAATRSPATAPRYMLFILLYLLIQHGLTFIVLQTTWDQPRLIMVYVPLLLMVVYYSFYSLLRGDKPAPEGIKMTAYWLLPVVITGSSFITSSKKAVEHYPVMKKNMAGDIYYGYTPDWENFLKLSAWCADSLPPGAVVASRKAPMSFVYGRGRDFFPVYTTPAVDTTTNMSYPDSALHYFHQNGITHVLLASLRRNPNKNTGHVINTLHRMIVPIARKYPHKLKLVKQMGTTEPAYLYEVYK